MATLADLLQDHGNAVAFVNVLAEQAGLPVPAYPVLIAVAAGSARDGFAPLTLLLLGILACLIADVGWYLAGRRHGNRVLRTICRVSISPDSCVNQTESLFDRWGVWSLLVAKFVPGFATLATALAGNRRVPMVAFLLADAVGAALFVGVAVALGLLFQDAVDQVVAVLEGLGQVGIGVVVAALVLFLLHRWWQRERLLRELRGERITVAELQQLMAGDDALLIIDARSAAAQARDGVIPGAVAWHGQAEVADPATGGASQVIVYCACPNEVTAARVARQVKQAFGVRVRPLLGGLDAWVAAGLPVAGAPRPPEDQPGRDAPANPG